VRLGSAFLRNAEIDVPDDRLLVLLSAAVSRVPPGTAPLQSVLRVGLKRRGEMPGLVGLTRWGEEAYGSVTRGPGRTPGRGRQTITFYTELLNQLSEKATLAVIVHELAHAWLNEHLSPEESEAREEEADRLAREWGFGEELDALEGETEPV